MGELRIAIVDSGWYAGACLLKSLPCREAEEQRQGGATAENGGQSSHADVCGRLIHAHCPDAEYVSVDVFEGERYADARVVSEGILWACEHGSDIIFVGLAALSSEDRTELEPACRYAREQSRILVAPVDNQTGGGYPAQLETALGVIAGDLTDPNRWTWWNLNGVDIAACGYRDTSQTAGAAGRRNACSSVAAAHCAGIIAERWRQAGNMSVADVYQWLKRKGGRRGGATQVYLGGRKFDRGRWRRLVRLRDKPLITQDKPFDVRKALHVGRAIPCAGMPLICQIMNETGARDRRGHEGASPAGVAALRDHADCVVVTGGDRAEGRRWISLAMAEKKNVVVTTPALSARLEKDLRVARDGGCRVWTPRMKLRPAPRWYFRAESCETPLPCFAVVCHQARGRSIAQCKDRVTAAARRAAKELLWVADVQAAWLADCALSIPLQEMERTSGLPLEVVMGIVQHEIRREYRRRGAQTVAVVLTAPIFHQGPWGQLLPSPWAEALLGLFNPQAGILVQGAVSAWLQEMYVKRLLVQWEVSEMVMMRDDEDGTRRLYRLQEDVPAGPFDWRPVGLSAPAEEQFWNRVFG